MKTTNNKLLPFILMAIILIGMNFIPVGGGLTEAGRNTIGIILCMLIIFITGCLPLGVAAICIMAMLFLTGAVPTFAAAISGFATGPVLFMLCANAMSIAVSSSDLSKRIVHFMLRLGGHSIKGVMLSLMYITALMSAFISNVPTCAMFVTIALSVIKLYETDEEQKKTGKAFMIATPVAAMIGGIMTPVGSSPNLVAIEVLKNMTGYQITFVEWSAYGTPIGLLLVFIAWFIISHVFPLSEIDATKYKDFVKSTVVDHKPDAKEAKLIIIMITMIVLWFLSSWIKSINMYIVAILGTMLMFFPGVEILEWNDFSHRNNWNSFFVVPMVITLGNAITANNLSSLLVSSVFSNGLNLPAFPLMLVLCLFVMVMMIFLPNGGAAITVLAAPFVTIALEQGLNPVMLITAMCFCCTNCYLLPVESVPLIAYSQGYFKMAEMPKATWMILVSLALLIALWNPLVASFIG